MVTDGTNFKNSESYLNLFKQWSISRIDRFPNKSISCEIQLTLNFEAFIIGVSSVDDLDKVAVTAMLY